MKNTKQDTKDVLNGKGECLHCDRAFALIQMPTPVGMENVVIPLEDFDCGADDHLGEGLEGMPCPADDCPSHEGHRYSAGLSGDEGSEEIILDGRYWDCECERHFIHRKADRMECPLCGAKEEDGQPDSHVSELNDPFNHFGKNQLLKEEDVPSFKNLLGKVPDLTGGKSTADFIRSIREETEE